MLLFDSNVFIYARGEHPHSEDCRQVLSMVAERSGWIVPVLVVLELTHYLRDGGEYSARILDAFEAVDTTMDDFRWAVEQSTRHAELNDHILLHNAHRCGCEGIVSYDGFFDRQQYFPDISRCVPGELL